jgi:hypothetical protein
LGEGVRNNLRELVIGFQNCRRVIIIGFLVFLYRSLFEGIIFVVAVIKVLTHSSFRILRYTKSRLLLSILPRIDVLFVYNLQVS